MEPIGRKDQVKYKSVSWVKYKRLFPIRTSNDRGKLSQGRYAALQQVRPSRNERLLWSQAIIYTLVPPAIIYVGTGTQYTQVEKQNRISSLLSSRALPPLIPLCAEGDKSVAIIGSMTWVRRTKAQTRMIQHNHFRYMALFTNRETAMLSMLG